MVGNNIKIYQADVRCGYAFMNHAYAVRKDADLKTLKDYSLVYEGTYNSVNTDIEDLLEEIFTDGNIGMLRQLMDEQCDKARSLSVSDVIEVDGVRYYVEPFGYEAIGRA